MTKASITQFEADVTHLKAVVKEKEANISNLNDLNAQLQGIGDSTEDRLRTELKTALADIFTYQEEISTYKRTITDKEYESQRMK